MSITSIGSNSFSSEQFKFASSFASSGLSVANGSTTNLTPPVVPQQRQAIPGNVLLTQGVVQTLNQSGINTSSSTQALALHTLMHDIFQAVQQGKGSSSQTVTATTNHDGSTTSTGYDHVASNLQNLIQQLGTNSTGSNSQNSTLNKLQSDYNALVQSVGGVSATQHTVGLQQFLSTLSQNLNAAGSSTPAIGSLFSTTA
jgi:hypothetical protein